MATRAHTLSHEWRRARALAWRGAATRLRHGASSLAHAPPNTPRRARRGSKDTHKVDKDVGVLLQERVEVVLAQRDRVHAVLMQSLCGVPAIRAW